MDGTDAYRLHVVAVGRIGVLGTYLYLREHMAQLYLRLGGIVPIARGITCQQVFCPVMSAAGLKPVTFSSPGLSPS